MRASFRRLVLAHTLSLLLASCGGQQAAMVEAPTASATPPPSASAAPALPPLTVREVPPDAKKLDVNFENRAHLVGYRFEPAIAPPGSTVKMTLYWRSDEAMPEDGWQLFTHIIDDTSEKTANLDGTAAAGTLREERDGRQPNGPDHWEPKTIYVDEMTYRVPQDTKSPSLTVLSGVWRGDMRLRIISGANDGDNRTIVGRIDTGIPRPVPPTENHVVPTLTVYKLNPGQPIQVDGLLLEPAWSKAAKTGAFVDVANGGPSRSFPVNADARLAWDDVNLYIAFHALDGDLMGGFTTPAKSPDYWTSAGQPRLWMKECVEMMLEPDADGDGKHPYYELQVNPQNFVFHSQYDTYNQPKVEPNGPFGHEDWDPRMKHAVHLNGTVDNPKDRDIGYDVEVAIPWASFGMAHNHPPAPGDVWRVNLYAMKNNGGVAWSPILGQGNFHKASRFGLITYATQSP